MNVLCEYDMGYRDAILSVLRQVAAAHEQLADHDTGEPPGRVREGARAATARV